MTIELTVSPIKSDLREELAEASGWTTYVDEVFGLLDAVLGATREQGPVRLGDVLVPRPRGRTASVDAIDWMVLRNGLTVTDAQARSLVARMLSGEGPYACLWRLDAFRVEPGWDGALRMVLSPSLEQLVTVRSRGLLSASVSSDVTGEGLRWESVIFDAARYVAFSSDLVAATTSGRRLVMSERWAHGYRSDRWWGVTADNVEEVLTSVSPCSLLSLFVDPVVHASLPMGDEVDFVAFRDINGAGRLDAVHVSDLDERLDLAAGGYDAVIDAEASASSCAVVPDEAGVVRADWDSIFT